MTTIEYQLTKSELITTGTLRRLTRPRIMASVVLMFLGAIVLIVGFGGLLHILGWFFLLFAILVPVGFMGAVYSVVNANPVETSKITMSFGDSGIIYEAKSVRAERSWDFFRSWSQSEKYFFLQTDNIGSEITIPKRAFTQEQLQSFFEKLAHISRNHATTRSET